MNLEKQPQHHSGEHYTETMEKKEAAASLEKVKISSEQLAKEQKDQENLARQTIDKEARASDETHTPQQEQRPQPRYFTKTDRERSFRLTMRHARSNMNRSQKIFSSIVHQPQIEKISELSARTIARPSGILGAVSVALIGMGFILIVAKRTGFTLAGSEFWILLCVGYLMGLIIEFVVKLLGRKPS